MAQFKDVPIKGFITTGTFTREVIKEATMDGAPKIDLVDGELFIFRKTRKPLKRKRIWIVKNLKYLSQF